MSWARYKQTLGKQLYLIIVACVQLVAKNCDRVTHVPASLMRAVLLKAGIQHSKSEILAMEINVFKTLSEFFFNVILLGYLNESISLCLRAVYFTVVV